MFIASLYLYYQWIHLEVARWLHCQLIKGYSSRKLSTLVWLFHRSTFACYCWPSSYWTIPNFFIRSSEVRGKTWVSFWISHVFTCHNRLPIAFWWSYADHPAKDDRYIVGICRWWSLGDRRFQGDEVGRLW